MSKGRKIAARIGAVFLSILLFLVVLEGLVRVFHLSQPRIGQKHPIYGTGYIPDQKAINEYGVLIEIGKHGYRGPAPALEKPPGTFRVLLLGDSFLQAIALPFDQIFFTILNKRFREKGLPIELISLGVEGYGTVQEYLVYQREGRRYDPDVVMLFFYAATDLVENQAPAGDRPSFELVDGKLVPKPFKVEHRGAVRDFLRKHVMVYNYLPDLYRERVIQIENRLKHMDPAARRQERLQKFEEQADIDGTASLLTRKAQSPAWQLSLAVLDRLDAEVRADHARLAVCGLPNVTQIYDRFWAQMVEKFPPPQGGYDRFRPQDILREHAQARGYDFLSVARELKEAAEKSGEMLFLTGDMHLNRLGNEYLADILEPVIVRYYHQSVER